MSESFFDQIKFIGQWAMSPLRTGAVSPSSKALAHAMAQNIPDVEGPVIELGPGTGVMTGVMIDRGIAPQDIYAVEYSRDFALELQKRFPKVNIIHGDAYELEKLLRPLLGHRKVKATMCSLPLFTQSLSQRQDLFHQSQNLSLPIAPFILFSYAYKSPIPTPDGYCLTKSKWVKRNIPPARAWTLKRESEPGEL